MSHTPGPWKIEERSGYNRIVGIGGKVILDTDGDDANTRLIAAAPELLEACRKMVARFQELSQDRSICVAPELCIMADAIAHAQEGG